MHFKTIKPVEEPEVVIEEWMAIKIDKNIASRRIAEITPLFSEKPWHLKRISPENSSLTVILFPRQYFEENREKLIPKLNMVSVSEESLILVSVPINDIETEIGRDIARKHWPCVFRPLAPDTIPDDILFRVQKYTETTRQNTDEKECSEKVVLLEESDQSISMSSESRLTADSVLNHPIMDLVRIYSQGIVGYLCTGKTVILSNEPCMACGMALVHARVKRVFICGNPSNDSPYTRHSLHNLPSLNHRFKAYIKIDNALCS
ncbi:tRNA-specific adenosine deaminase 3 [Nematocida sp. AWRm80]|nr:tRNA-specific adenosine deaminase 3 [Nematocida sp. AWRm80]